jgi:uncharacterized membrane protein HdeD (DUF308 family)
MGDDRSSLDVVRESEALAYAVGLMTLAAGLVLLFWPDRTLTVIARISGLLIALQGVSDLWAIIRRHRGTPYWGLFALRAAVNLGFGAALLFWPKPTISVLVWLVGLNFVLAGVLGLLLRSQVPSEEREGLLGRSLVTIAFGVAIMVWPDVTANALAFLVGAVLALVGLALLWTGYRVGKLKKAI